MSSFLSPNSTTTSTSSSTTTNTTTAAKPQSQQRLGGGRNKVDLGPGHSLMDWIRFSRNGKDLTNGGHGRRRVTLEELAHHSSPNDAWMALRGKVYNITPYLKYHPGGFDELMRGAGIDGTKLFDEYHPWVNDESMLSSCLVGYLDTTQKGFKQPSCPLPPVNEKSSVFVSESPSVQSLKRPSSNSLELVENIRFDWFQTSEYITWVIYVKGVVDTESNCNGGRCRITLNFGGGIPSLWLSVTLDGGVTASIYSMRVLSSKVELKFCKLILGTHWDSFGIVEQGKIETKCPPLNTIAPMETTTSYMPLMLSLTEVVTHDTTLYMFSTMSVSCFDSVPTGHHVRVRAIIDGSVIERDYTPVPVRDMAGYIALLVKRYPDGPMSSHISNLSPGETLEFSAPKGTFNLSDHDGASLGMLAGGTGITPMIGLLNAGLQLYGTDKKRKFHKMRLLFANHDERDILLRNELDTMVHAAADVNCSDGNYLEVRHILSQPSDLILSKWQQDTGRISKALILKHMPPPDSNVLIAVCGRTEFTNDMVVLLNDLGYKTNMVHTFSS